MSPSKSPLEILRRVTGDLSGVARTASTGSALRYFANIASALPEVLRTQTLAPADARMSGHLCRFHPYGQTVTLPGSMFGGARELYARGVYFALPQFRFNSGDIVFDLGANLGLFSILASRTARTVVAVEAQSGLCQAIRENVARNPGPAEVVIAFGLIAGNSGVFSDTARLVAASDYGTAPPRLSMNELLSQHRLDRIDFLKIDVEGSEFDLLSGDIEWLPKVSKIAMEVHPEFGDPADLVAVLSNAGFVTEARDVNLRPTRSIGQAGGYLYAWRQ